MLLLVTVCFLLLNNNTLLVHEFLCDMQLHI